MVFSTKACGDSDVVFAINASPLNVIIHNQKCLPPLNVS